MYTIQHAAYCGMSGIRSIFDRHHEARNEAAERLRAFRRRYRVVTLARGEQWEILEPDNCVMVPDDCGTLTLSHVTYECKECGYGHETRDAARECCMLEEDYA